LQLVNLLDPSDVRKYPDQRHKRIATGNFRCCNCR
uniref:Uncharacterized protein n=1 Tax=Ciona savignyi TaxID=51511 RepID=H2Z8I4_CIOSA